MFDAIPGVPLIETPLAWQCWLAREPVDFDTLAVALSRPLGSRVGRAVAVALSHDLFEHRACTLAELTALPEATIRELVRHVRLELAEDPDFRSAVERAVHPLGVRRFVH